MCHLVEWMVENGSYRHVIEVQKGACETASKTTYMYPR